MNLMVIGGSDAGISAALRAREVDPSAGVTVVLADVYPNFSICGLPYYLSGDVSRWQSLAHRTADELAAGGIDVRCEHVVRAIDPAAHQVSVSRLGGSDVTLAYDRLVIATGALPVRPAIDGLDLDGVFVLHTMQDAFALSGALARRPRTAIIVGAGYIGVEMAEAFVASGVQVTMIDRHAEVFRTVDPQLGRHIRNALKERGVEVLTDTAVMDITKAKGGLLVSGLSGVRRQADLVLVAAGVRPDAELARAAGAATGVRGAIRVSRRMETTLPGIFAAGDCVETHHRLLDHPTYLPLGTTAHKQGSVAGENAVGGDRRYEGSLGTQTVKVFDTAVARTGLTDREARGAGFDPLTVDATVFDHKAYYPDAHRLWMRLSGDRSSGQLLGAQIVGHQHAQVSKRIDTVATALFHGMTVDALNDLDLSYTPPFGSPWDALQIAAQEWARARSLQSKPEDRASQPDRSRCYTPNTSATTGRGVRVNKIKALILCTGNSARSQMAEALLREAAGDRFEVSSAGLEPQGVNPFAVRVMAEVSIDISGQRSKSVDEFEGRTDFDFVITVCDHAAANCPVFPGSATRLHWSTLDPAAAEGTEDERLAVFRHARDELASRVSSFLTDLSRGRLCGPADET